MRDSLTINILLSSQRALLGAITQNVRAITLDYNSELLTLRAYFDKGTTNDDKELINVALTEIAADVWNDIRKYNYEPVDLDFPNKMYCLKHWIYMRHEDYKE